MRCVLCIDDDKDVLSSVSAVLRNSGYSTLTAVTGSDGLRLLQRALVDLVVVDYEMPGMNGSRVSEEIRRLRPRLPIVLFTGAPDGVPEEVRRNIDEVICKVDFSGLLRTVEKLTRSSIAKAELS